MHRSILTAAMPESKGTALATISNDYTHFTTETIAVDGNEVPLVRKK